MTFFSYTRIAALATAYLCLASSFVARAQDTTHFSQDEIASVWTVFTGNVAQGNGVFLSPNGDVLLAISSDGLIRALNPLDGAPLWSYPPVVGTTSQGGIFFSDGYTVHCINNGASSIIVALDLVAGTEVLRTGSIQGKCAGTPVTTADGRYILTTHNVNEAVGFFSVYDTLTPDTPAFTFTFDAVEQPFGALGHFWGPGAGYYEGGEANTNDVFIWCLDTNPSAANGTSSGQVFAFQLPMPPATNFNVTLVGGERDFQSSLPPVITNDGFSMYWSVTRSQHIAWVGEPGLRREDFGTDGVNVGFDRGDPPRSSAKVPVTLSSDPAVPFVVGPTAGTQIFRMSFDFSEGGDAATLLDTSAVVSSKVLISRDDAIVYAGIPAPDGNLVGLDAASLQVLWNFTVPAGIAGEMALSLNGDTVYFADVVGGVQAVLVADAPAVTLAPTPSPANQTDAPAVGTFSPAPAGPNATAPSVAPPMGLGTAAPIGLATVMPTFGGNDTTMMPIDVNGTVTPTSGSSTDAPTSGTEVPVVDPNMTSTPAMGGNVSAPTSTPVDGDGNGTGTTTAPSASVPEPNPTPMAVPRAPVAAGSGSSAKWNTFFSFVLVGVIGFSV